MRKTALLPILLCLALPLYPVAKAASTLAQPVAAQTVLGQPTNCTAPSDITDAAGALPHAAAALAAGHTLRILALGSGTLLAQGRAPAGMAFPQRMAADLRAKWPGATVDLALEGGKGLTAGDQLTRLRARLAAGQYDLVIWQTGTVEAVHKIPVAEFTANLEQGAALVTASGADLVLVDQQFSRMLQSRTDLAPYQQALRTLSTGTGALLFRRYELMHQWVTSGQIDLERAGPNTREAVAETLHACIGRALGTLVINGVAKSS